MKYKEFDSTVNIKLKLSDDIKWWKSPKICRWQWYENESADIVNVDSARNKRKTNPIDDFDVNKDNYPQFHCLAMEHIMPRLSKSCKFQSDMQFGRKNEKPDDSNESILHHISSVNIIQGTMDKNKKNSLLADTTDDGRELFPIFDRCPPLRVLKSLVDNNCYRFSDLLNEINEYNKKLWPTFIQRTAEFDEQNDLFSKSTEQISALLNHTDASKSS